MLKSNLKKLIAVTSSTAILGSSVFAVNAFGAATPGWKADAKKPITFHWYLNFSWFPTANQWGGNEVTKYITKKTGVNIVFDIPTGNENAKLSTMMAAGTLPDYLTLGWYEPAVPKLSDAKMVYALDTLANKYDKSFFDVVQKDSYNWYKQPDGHVYGYPNYSDGPEAVKKGIANGTLTSNESIMVNKKMYEAIGKPDMTTPAGFLKALKAAKKKFGKINGQPLIPFGCNEWSTTGGNSSMDIWIQDMLGIPKEKNGKLYNRNFDPEYLKWMKVFRQANQDGLISKDIFVDKRNQISEKLTQGRYFCLSYQWKDMMTENQSLFDKNPNNAYIAVDAIQNSNKKIKPILPGGAGIAGWTLTMIGKNCKDPKRAIEFLTYLISDEGQHDIELGSPDMWQKVKGVDQLKPAVASLLAKDRTAFDKKYAGNDAYWMLSNDTVDSVWRPAMTGASLQPSNWTKPYVRFLGQYDGVTPTDPNSKEGIISTKVGAKWAEIQPKLILAKSEKDFDKLITEYKNYLKSVDNDKLMEYENKELAKHKAKLGLK